MTPLKTYEITFAWRDQDTGELDPEFTRTRLAWSEDQAVEDARGAIENAPENHPSEWMPGLPIRELELRGVKEIPLSDVGDHDSDVAGYDDSGFKSLLA